MCSVFLEAFSVFILMKREVVKSKIKTADKNGYEMKSDAFFLAFFHLNWNILNQQSIIYDNSWFFCLFFLLYVRRMFLKFTFQSFQLFQIQHKIASTNNIRLDSVRIQYDLGYDSTALKLIDFFVQITTF